MRTILTFGLCCLLSLDVASQDISVAFTATGAATRIDSVTATNLRSNESVTLPGSSTLVLTKKSGMDLVNKPGTGIAAFPNPFQGESNIVVTADKPQEVNLRILDMTGKVIAQITKYIQPGENGFFTSISGSGIFSIILITDSGSISTKVLCLPGSVQENLIRYSGSAQGTPNSKRSPGHKSQSSGYMLGYQEGDVIHYACTSGDMTTIMTDVPAASRTYEVEFTICKDPDGKSYSTVGIGDQVWMAENLAWLPAAGPSSNESDTSPFYYVYGYEGNSVAEAKEYSNYLTYGVIYNWEAAKTACPAGWQLPNDDDWKILEICLGMSESDANISGWRSSGDVGKKLKSATGWYSNGNGSNASGFGAIPAGYRPLGGGFTNLGHYTGFWTSTGVDPNLSYRHTLYHSNNGVYRSSGYSRSYGFSVRCLKKE